ncbi:hypothetical protein CPAR01_03707 [Colletotrichum paranaense]|uniref:Uncharacterized protein n=1 Tax=Colletotrichum paranaense TaxID=1914294 RepID=A0ABQ9SU87_9PEZI|nr:uncharacterized protein CPAR01_03707 [Colletotrichum paranaense]KAK1543074.1 hypothetical protein CPAR01_03707 [Colletotrichum paranaense]
MLGGPAICNLQPAILLSAARPWRNTGRYSTTANQAVSRPDARHVICPLWSCAEDRRKFIPRLLGRPSTSPMPTSTGVSRTSRNYQMPSLQPGHLSVWSSQRGLIALGGSLSLANNGKPQPIIIGSAFGPERWLVLRDGLMICFCNQRTLATHTCAVRLWTLNAKFENCFMQLQSVGLFVDSFPLQIKAVRATSVAADYWVPEEFQDNHMK